MTSIDLPTELVAEQALIGRRGLVVAIDPNTGDIIAMVSTPAFDPKPFGRGLTPAEYAVLRDGLDVPLLIAPIRERVSARLDREATIAGVTLGVTDRTARPRVSPAFLLFCRVPTIATATPTAVASSR